MNDPNDNFEFRADSSDGLQDSDGANTFDFLPPADSSEGSVSKTADMRRTRQTKELKFISAVLTVLAVNYLMKDIVPPLNSDPVRSAPSLDWESIMQELRNNNESTPESC